MVSRPMLTEGEYVMSADHEVEQLRANFLSFIQATGERIQLLEERLARIEQGLSHAAGDGTVTVPVQVQSPDKWQQIKQRLPPRLAQAIDVLLLQGSMSGTQLAAAMRMDRSNCSKNVVQILLRQGLIVRNGRELSLKQL